jgi:DNA-directed RNA polymerase specialized sigma24 family protein
VNGVEELVRSDRGRGRVFLNALVADAAAGAEVATLTGVPESRVRSRVRQALDRVTIEALR